MDDFEVTHGNPNFPKPPHIHAQTILLAQLGMRIADFLIIGDGITYINDIMFIYYVSLVNVVILMLDIFRL